MKNDETITPVVNDGLCTGCGTCVSLCPLAAISLTKDNSRGVYIPKVDQAMCNRCGICFQVCPGHSVDFDQLNTSIFGKKPENNLLGHYINCYTGYAIDNNIRYNAASGGLVSSMLIYTLEKELIDGALVTTMSTKNPLEPEPFIARTKEEVILASKSKYCPVPANTALKTILDDEGKYAAVGLPCHIHGLRKAEEVNGKLKQKIVLHLGIFCGHSPNFLSTEFLLWQRGIAPEDVAGIDYRGGGWPGGISIALRSGQRIFIPHFEAWKPLDMAFISRRCLFCCDGAGELADISFGDAWLPQFSDDTAGRSVVVTRKPVGEVVLQRMAEEGVIELSNIEATSVAQSQQDFSTKKASIKVYMMYAKIIRQKRPLYNAELSKLRLTDIVNAFIRLLGLYLSSRRCFWKLIPVLYDRLIPFLGRVWRLFKTK